MTFESAIKGLRDGMAAKRPSMRGYVFKDTSMLTEEEAGSEKCALVFVEADGKRTAFPMNGLVLEAEADGKGKADAKMTINADFVAGILADDWERATVEGYEAARAGGGRW